MSNDIDQAIVDERRSSPIALFCGTALGAGMTLISLLNDQPLLIGAAAAVGAVLAGLLVAALEPRRSSKRPDASAGDTPLADQFHSVMEGVLEQERKVEVQRRRLNGAIRQRTSELMIANRELERRDRLRDEFVSLLAHEFRTPLTSVRSYVDLLLRYGADVEPLERQQFLSIVSSQVHRMTRLVSELLDLSRLRTGRLEMCIEDCPVADAVDDILDATGRMEDRAEKRIVVEPVPKDVAVRCDRERLQQILSKLLRNSIRYTPDDAAIAVKCRTTPAMVAFEVTDNGPGIPLDERELVFEPFFRTRAIGQSDQEGTGLGLYLCREFARRMNGNLRLESSETGGARFTLELPRAIGAPVTTPEKHAGSR